MIRVIETGARRDGASLAVVMIHGRGRSAEEMASFAERFGIASVRYVCPDAPGGTWYPERFLEPIERNQPALDHSLASIGDLLDRLNHDGIADERIVLCGFSQGACLAAEVVLRRQTALAAAILFTGGLIGPPGTTWQRAGSLHGVPVLATGSDTDDWVPSWRMRETADVLAGYGAEVELVIYPEREHLVSDDEIARATALLHKLLNLRPLI